MSQERTRFPIQPKDVRRSAKSNKDGRLSGQGGRAAEPASSDKPTVPPHQRKQADAIDAQETDGAEDSDGA